MNLSVDHAPRKVPVTIVTVTGDVDGSNYEALIARARELYTAGTRHVLFDLSGVPYMSSAGLVALHSISRLLRGEPALDTTSGWEAYRTIARETSRTALPYMKLLNPQPRVLRVLELSGLTTVYEIHTDRAAAIASFG
jgi:anti-anti-sigma factor